MPDLHAILHWTASYGYPGVFAALGAAALGIGVPIPVTALLLTLGALSGLADGPNIAALAVAGIAGIAVGHIIDYGAGRLGQKMTNRWLARVQRSSRVNSLVQSAMSLRGGFAGLVFASRFLLTPIASPISFLAGATRMRPGLYLGLEASGAGVYVMGNLLLGRIIGPGLLSNGAALPVFWIVVALLTLVPVVLVRVSARVLGRQQHRAGSS